MHTCIISISYIPGARDVSGLKREAQGRSALNRIHPEHPVYNYFVSYHNHSNTWFAHNNRDVKGLICGVAMGANW